MQQKKMEFDLQALFGTESDPTNDFTCTQPIPTLQPPVDAQGSQWNVPLSAPNAGEMSELDQVLFGYLNDNSGMLMETPGWESLMQGLN